MADLTRKCGSIDARTRIVESREDHPSSSSGDASERVEYSPI